MNEDYDVIVLGTGFTECVLSGLLSVDKKRVLHMDRNNYYGGASASLTLTNMYSKFRGEGQKPPEAYGSDRDWNVDLIPKFIMASGNLVKLLLHAKTSQYLEFKSINGSFVYRGGEIHKVPATDGEALKSPLMSFLEKRRCRKFFIYVQDYEPNDPKTWEGRDLKKMKMSELFKQFDLQQDTCDFIGHAMALYTDEKYLDQPALECILRVQLYTDSLSRYGNSPYIYPMYGLGELPQAFARLSAIHGGTYMLNKPITSVKWNEEKKMHGVTSDDGTAYAPIVIGDPSYFTDRVKKAGQVVRCICILTHPVPNTNDGESAQIIIPQKQVNRQHDIYVAVISHSHKVAGAGKWIAIVSTTVETSNAAAEIEPGLKLLGPIAEKFLDVADIYEPTTDGKADHIFVSKSYDATSHFETACADILDMYERIAGHPFDFSKVPIEENPEEGQQQQQ